MKKLRRSIQDMLAEEVEAASGSAKRAPLRYEQAITRAPAVKVKSTLYLDPAVHRKLQEIAFEQRIKLHDLYLDAIDLLLREAGQRSIAEIIGHSGKAA